jgi:3-methyladenine DNA glycosylase/8-oxoguanine DNA glycosylase
MEEFVRNHFGSYAGYAQLYLYHFWRNHGFS